MSGGQDPPKGKTTLQDLKKNPPNHPDYKAPKSGARRVNSPNGKGWIDRNGRIWVPDDHKGTHAPHWDVQDAKGGGYVPVYPLEFVTPKNVAIGVGTAAVGYIIYKIIVGAATWQCGGCGVLVTP